MAEFTVSVRTGKRQFCSVCHPGVSSCFLLVLMETAWALFAGGGWHRGV